MEPTDPVPPGPGSPFASGRLAPLATTTPTSADSPAENRQLSCTQQPPPLLNTGPRLKHSARIGDGQPDGAGRDHG